MEHLSDQHLPRCALYPGRDLGEGNAIPYFSGTRCSALGSCMGRRPSHTPIAQTQPSCSAPSASVPQLTCLLPRCPLAETKPSLQITPCPRPHPALPQELCLQGLSHPKPDHSSWRGLAAQRAQLAKWLLENGSGAAAPQKGSPASCLAAVPPADEVLL